MLKKNKIFLCVLSLTILVTLGGTVAYFTADNNKVNTINMGKMDVEVVEKVANGIKTDVGATIKAGSSPCWVRLFVGFPVGMQQQTLIETAPASPNSNWIKEGNYYYYQTALGGKSTDETVILFDEIKAEENLDINQVQSELDIVVYAEAIQKEFGNSAVEAFRNK